MISPMIDTVLFYVHENTVPGKLHVVVYLDLFRNVCFTKQQINLGLNGKNTCAEPHSTRKGDPFCSLKNLKYCVCIWNALQVAC